MHFLTYLQKQVDLNTEQLCFPREERAFTAHLTLGRVRNDPSLDERKKIGRVISETSFISEIPVAVDSVKLMQSQLTPTGAIYSQLYEAKLKG
jgi:2'-5' RNA ligase